MSKQAFLFMAALMAMALASSSAWAGGTAIGWSDAVSQFADEGQAAAFFALILGIIAVGFILMFGMTQMVAVIVVFCLGGALAANAGAIAALFGGGGGGGSVLDVVLP